MSEKQFDHIENRIREAAENSEPAFDEYAWSLMEARLDKEDNKKRPVFIWWGLLLLLFIVAGVLYFNKNDKPAEILISQKVDSAISDDKSVIQKNTPSETKAPITRDTENDSKIGLNIKGGTGEVVDTKIIGGGEITANHLNDTPGNKGKKTKGKISSNQIGGEVADNPNMAAGLETSEIIPDKTGMNKLSADSASVVVQPAPEKSDSSLQNSTKLLPDSNRKEKKKVLKQSRFYLLAALGADAGSTQLLSFNNSQVTAKYGVGIGYQFNKKISLQTGFYASNKKYIAGPEDYNAKPGSYWSIVQIVKVDAACLVYDIPLTFRYNFLLKPKTGYYATMGVSSYIMKKEEYDYYYIRYNMPHEVAKTYTGNKDFFSVFNLSAGVEKKLSPVLYIQAEPSIGIPLSGVGEGSVKLYSAALQVALKYQPVKKR